jgi:dUTP pyrophosphatase
MIQVSRQSERATLPTRGSIHAAGWDLYASEETNVPANGKAIVSTGIVIAIPLGHYGRIAPRSGMAWTKHVNVGAGVIDADYRGVIGVVIFNHSKDDLNIKYKDRVAQLIIEKINTNILVEVPWDILNTTERNRNAFGSSGV